MDKAKILVLLVFSLSLSFNGSAYHQCYDTTVNHDTHYHGDGISGNEAYQDWHASFANYRSHRGRSSTCGGSAPNFIDISDDDGNSVRVSNPGDNYRVWTSDYSWLEGGDYVTVYYGGNDGVTTSSVTRRMPQPNEAPTISNPEPNNGAETSSDPVTLSVDISDPDSSSIDVRFYDASDNSLIGSDTVSSGQTASTNWGVNTGQTYNWYVEADDGVETVQSSDWSFTTNGVPSASNPQPNDGAVITDETPQISAEYNDPEGDSGTLTFYDSSDSEIGSCNVDSTQRCGVEWSSASHGSNTWYAVASDNVAGSSTSPDWSFVINQVPDTVTSPVKPDDQTTVYGTSTELEVQVSDPDGDNLAVEFLNNRSNLSSSERTVTGVSDGGTASVTLDSLDRGADYKWWVNVSDNWESTPSNDWSFHVNSLPSVSGVEPEDNAVVAEENVVIGSDVYDEESTSTGDLTIDFYKGNDVLIDSKQGTSGEFTSVVYPGTQIGETYEWYMEVSDGYETYRSNVFSFEKTTSETYRVEPRIEYRYSDIILDETGSKDIFFVIENQISNPKELRTYLEGVNATFAENNQNSLDYTLEGNSEKRFTVYVDPASTGTKTLRIITENQEFGVNTTASIPVTVKNYEQVTGTSEVPGIGTIQLLMLLLVSAYLYSVRL